MIGNLCVAILVGLVMGLSPHTSGSRLVPSIAGGLLAGAAVFAYRVRASRRAVRAGQSAVPARPVRRPPALVWATLLASAVVFAPIAAQLFDRYTGSIWKNGHGLFVPLIMGSLALAILRRDTTGDADASAWGFVPVALGLALVVVDGAVQTLYLATLGLVVFIPGLCLLLLGARRTRALAFPLLLGVFLLPLPTSLGTPLQLPTATAAGVATLFENLGVPVLRRGAVLDMPGAVYVVSANCSGFSAFYAGIGAALVLGFLGRSRLRAGMLLLAVWPLTWLANVLRSAILVALCEARGIGFADTPFHGLSGIVAFWLVMLGLLLLADRRHLRRALS